MKIYLQFQWRWWILAVLFISSSLSESISESGEYVWMTDSTTQKRYQVLKSSYDRDKAFVVGESTLSNRFTHEYLDNLANQCDAVTDPPGVFEFLNHTYLAVVEFCFHPDIYTYSFEIYFRLLEAVEWEPYLIATLVAIVFTIARYTCTFFFLRTVVGKKFATEQSQKKAITPLWNTISYAFLFTVEAFTLYFYGYNDFIYPLCIFKEIHFRHGYFDDPVPLHYYWLYMFQMGYYMHSFYATIRLDIRRKDTSVILIHHVLTIALLSFSFFARLYRVGVLVLFLHDISDVLLESGKFMVAARSKYPEHANILEYVANCLFGAFVASWFYLRIYLYPTKVIYGTTWGVYLTHLDREAYFFLFFNVMLVALYFLHIYWSYFIVVMLLKKATGRMPKIEDEREFDSDSSLTPVKANGVHGGSPKAPATNGVHKRKKFQ